MDKELERRGHCFVRYADDCNVYVRSRRAGERVMALLRQLYARLRLTVNEAKSAVASVFGRKFLGYSFWVAPGGMVKRRRGLQAHGDVQAAHQATDAALGRAQHGAGGATTAQYVLGWKAYFRLAQTPQVWRTLDEWLRHRMRAIQLKHWRRGTTMYRELRALGRSRTLRNGWQATPAAGGVTAASC